jgi:hypothetical protein
VCCRPERQQCSAYWLVTDSADDVLRPGEFAAVGKYVAMDDPVCSVSSSCQGGSGKTAEDGERTVPTR